MTHERDPRRPHPASPAAGSGPFPGRPHHAAARNGTDALDDAMHADLGGPRGSDYDALADLFLGESDGPTTTRRTPVPGSLPPPSRSPTATAGFPLSPSDHTSPGPGAPQSPSHRLTVSPSHPPPDPARIDGLIIGHLPVLASAWVTQYARHLAEQTNAWIGLVKVRAGQVSVELVAPAAPGGPTAAPPPAPRESLDAALADGARVARHWLIRVDELAEARLAELAGLDGVTLLTGADEAAVVASYRTLKLLGEHADGDAPSRLGVAIMGASADIARDAATRLARTVQVHLGVTLPLNACVPRIGAARSVTLFRGELSGGTEAALPRIVDAIRSAAPTAAPEPSPTPTMEAASPATTTEPAVAPEEAPMHGATVPALPAESHVPAERTAMEAAPASASRFVAPAWAEPVATPSTDAPSAPAPGSSVATSPVGLAAHLEGLRALPARCPIAPAVEIAIDSHGRVHLLADAAAANPVEQLIAASGWAALNRDWVTLAAGAGSSAAAAGAAVLHVFTADARNARQLLDADVRVHLLLRVSVAGQDVAVCRPLN